MPGWSDALARLPTVTAPATPEGRPMAHRAFKTAFKKIRLAPEPEPAAAVLSHLWGSTFNGD